MSDGVRRFVAAMAARLDPAQPVAADGGPALLRQLAAHLREPGEGWPYPPSEAPEAVEAFAEWLERCANTAAGRGGSDVGE